MYFLFKRAGNLRAFGQILQRLVRVIKGRGSRVKVLVGGVITTCEGVLIGAINGVVVFPFEEKEKDRERETLPQNRDALAFPFKFCYSGS